MQHPRAARRITARPPLMKSRLRPYWMSSFASCGPRSLWPGQAGQLDPAHHRTDQPAAGPVARLLTLRMALIGEPTPSCPRSTRPISSQSCGKAAWSDLKMVMQRLAACSATPGA